MATQGEAASTLVSCVASQLEASDQFFPGRSSDQMYVSENKVVVPSMVLDSENGRQFKINK